MEDGDAEVGTGEAVVAREADGQFQRVEALLQQIDKPTLAGVKPKFYQLKYTDRKSVV